MPDPLDFATTQWTRIRLAREKDRDSREAIARTYRAPIYNFILSRGFAEADAEDLAQETFLEVFREGFLEGADRARGRFRALLLAVTRHVIARAKRRAGAAKRGGGRDAEPLDPDLPGGDLRDEEFDRLWVQDLVRRALERIEREESRDGAIGAKALKLVVFRGRSYEETAKALGVKLHDVKNAIHRSRARLRAAVKELVAEYAGSRGEYEDEVAYLGRFLGRDPHRPP
jgi:RNA polymerase sigma-70 factor (ECF subfamily)